MSATQELIAAALAAADELDKMTYTLTDGCFHPHAEQLREACARAMAQPAAPDMAEVEMLVREYGNACRSDAVDVIATGDDPESCGAAHAALLDYVRGVIAERDQFRDAAKMVQPVVPHQWDASGERWEKAPCGECHLQLGERCDVCGALAAAPAAHVPEPSKDRINPYRNADSGLYGPDYQNQQTEVAPDATVPAEVPMPESDYRLIGPDYSETVWNREHMRAYGGAREAAGYARGLADDTPAAPSALCLTCNGRPSHGVQTMTSPLYNICTRCGRRGHCAASCKEPTR